MISRGGIVRGSRDEIHWTIRQGRTGDALASAGYEGRGKLRKSAGIRKRELIRGIPNGGTRRTEGAAP